MYLWCLCVGIWGSYQSSPRPRPAVPDPNQPPPPPHHQTQQKPKQGKVATINANQDMNKVTADIRTSLH